ncbi:Hypothetical protein NTJ_10377 [Nesidiocoris tenuis]|uniref:Peptidase A2 domain-containing protein n=1 Tax=Nesidiocoris tenuis TaxID=355587 RepID=A0ABN7B001_9HEMI|nr:Hypothetical protein NTJ_10377 [Nesidiocoris tenuis]
MPRPRQTPPRNEQERQRGLAMKDFDIDPFNPETSEWEYWAKRFKIALRASNILEEDEKRDCLFAKLGAKIFKNIVDYFSPVDVETVPFDELFAILTKQYGCGDVSLSERLKFNKINRDDFENIAEFGMRLRSQASKCRFGVSLEERLRDQFLFGINNSTWQQEILKSYPSVDSTLDQIESLCRILETAKLQQESIMENTRSTNNLRVVAKPNSNSRQRNSPKTTRRSFRKDIELVRGKDCFRCGNLLHKELTSCHVCFKSNNVRVKASAFRTNYKSEEDISSGSESDDEPVNQTARIRKIGGNSELILDVVINKKHIEMLFDTGATKTVISEKVWREIGSPPLKKSSSLLAYTGDKVDTLGKAQVLVKAFGKELKLQSF